jgi:hypothetical protein
MKVTKKCQRRSEGCINAREATAILCAHAAG